jgi:spore coat polysaccharide biosynthesis predicted glycosyltransferase SpsG
VVAAGTDVQVGIYCDLGPRIGAGHAVRCTALAQGLAGRGLTPVLVGDFAQVPWVGQQTDGIESIEAGGVDEFVALARAREWTGVVMDSYLASPQQWQQLRDLARPILAIDDEANRELPVDLVVNQNLAAVDYDYSALTQASVLRGPDYALVRSTVAGARPRAYARRPHEHGPLRVLVVLGGTDAASGSVAIAQRLLDSGQRLHVRVLTNDVEALSRVDVPPGSRLEAHPTQPDIAPLMAWADLAVSAAGSTVWELCCLGVPMALVTVAANQEDNYRHLVAKNLAIGLGPLPVLLSSTASLAWTLEVARLNEVGARAWSAVDGRGAARAAEAFAALLVTA